MRENMAAAGGGSKQGKGAAPQQQGLVGVAEQLVGSLAARLIGILCVFSCGYVALLLIVSHGCWSNGSSHFGNAADCSLSNVSHTVLVGEKPLVTAAAAEDRRKETSLDRIVFGIGASAHLWTKRRDFVNLWWKQSHTRGFVWFDRDLGEDWKSNDPPYRVSEDTSRFNYTHKTGHRAAIRISRIVSESYRLGLADVDWFVMGDDDTFFFTENLVTVLSKYDHTQLWYIGSNSEDHIQNQLFSYNMAYGGGGFAISYPLAKLLAERQDDCMERYPWLFGSDDRMKACMSELGVPLTKEPGFHQFDIRGDAHGYLAAHPVAPIVSLHHLEAIHALFPNHTRSSAIAHLLKAANVSPLNIFQQSICYDEKKRWSFSVSWGYVVHVYKEFVAPNVLEVPTLTFLSWHRRRESYAFPLNSRPREREICEEPSSFYMGEVRSPDEGEEGGLIRMTYNNGDRLNRIRVCQQRNKPLSLVKTVHVDGEPLGIEWIQNPRRQCCRVTDIKEKSISIHLGACREGESLIGEEFAIPVVEPDGIRG